MSDQQERWLQTDEIEEFIDALEHTAWVVGELTTNVRPWKWLLIALHSAFTRSLCLCSARPRYSGSHRSHEEILERSMALA
jgi:hypothetical protein